MKTLRIGRFIVVIVAISLSVFILSGLIQSYFYPTVEKDTGPDKISISALTSTLFTQFKLISPVVTFVGMLCGFFFSTAWKWNIFRHRLVLCPNLNGTWNGWIKSTWHDEEFNKTHDSIPAIMTIKQSLFKISFKMRTEEMTSRSFISGFEIDDENQIKRVSYSYDSLPIERVIERSRQNVGTAMFDLEEEFDPETQKNQSKLRGRYWTDRKTTGEIEMNFFDKKILDISPAKLGEHPISKARKYKS